MNPILSRKLLLLQFSKYLIVGGAAFLIDFLTLYGLTEWFAVHYITSATMGFLAGLILNYALCLAWIFDHRAIDNRAHEFMIFGTIGIATMGTVLAYFGAATLALAGGYWWNRRAMGH